MIDYIYNFEWNGLLAIVLYWVPASLCAYGYTVRTWREYQSDLRDRHKDYYLPTLTVGVVLGRVLVTITPLLNLWAVVVDVGPQVFRSFFKWIGDILNIPLVPRKKDSEVNSDE